MIGLPELDLIERSEVDLVATRLGDREVITTSPPTTAARLVAEVRRLRAALEDVRERALCRAPGFQQLDRASIATIAGDALEGP